KRPTYERRTRMKPSFWRRWFNSLRSVKQANPTAHVRRRRVSLCLERLEDRVTPALTPQMVLDINPTGLNWIGSAVAVGPVAYLAGDDGLTGYELWKTDGTAAGTVLVKDIYPGSAGSSLSSLTAVNSTLFFLADDGTTGWELWKSDGTGAGTVLV